MASRRRLKTHDTIEGLLFFAPCRGQLIPPLSLSSSHSISFLVLCDVGVLSIDNAARLFAYALPYSSPVLYSVDSGSYLEDYVSNPCQYTRDRGKVVDR